MNDDSCSMEGHQTGEATDREHHLLPESESLIFRRMVQTIYLGSTFELVLAPALQA